MRSERALVTAILYCGSLFIIGYVMVVSYMLAPLNLFCGAPCAEQVSLVLCRHYHAVSFVGKQNIWHTG